MTALGSKFSSRVADYLDSSPAVQPITPKTATSLKRHLAVYQSTAGCPFGVELDHNSLVNIWVPRDWVAVARLPGIQRTLKMWTGNPGSPWLGADGKGANSNLRSYDAFKGHDLVRFRIVGEDEFHAVMAEVLR